MPQKNEITIHCTLKKYLSACLILILLPGIVSCSQKVEGEGKVVVKINDCSVTLDEFQARLAHEVRLYHDFTPDEKSKKEFLNELIKKEVLIQEAVKLKLERSEKFIKTIERYWESTLIRTLMEMKGEQISKNVCISKEEILALYDRDKRSEEGAAPLAEMEEEIVRILKERKKTRLMAEWISEIEARAVIEIDEDLLSKY